MGDHVFICYAREDEAFVLKLATNLKDRGVSIWLDQWDISPGTDWDQTIDGALQECAQFLIVLSPTAVASKEVRSELRTALNLNKLIVPVLHQTCRIPRRLQQIQHVDLTSGGPDDEATLQQMLRVLRVLARRLPISEDKNLGEAREETIRPGQEPPKHETRENVAQEETHRPARAQTPREEVVEQIPDVSSHLSPAESQSNWAGQVEPREQIFGYLDFELEVGSGSGREYPVVVVHSPVGEAQETMRFPFDELALENRLLAIQNALLYSGEKRHRRVPQERTVQDFGQSLFNALFTGEVRNCYDMSQREAARQGRGLRLKLCLHSPELAALPWEFLYDPRQDEYVCLSRHTPLVRSLDLSQPIQPLTVTPPLRILGMIAHPRDLPKLDFDRERQRVEEAVKRLRAQGLVEVTWLPGQTWRDLLRAMRSGPWHVFHFIGHGGFDRNADEGLIVLADEEGLSHRLNATQLGRMLADHHSLRLVVLNACEGGQGSERDIFSSTATILLRRGIPAVVAMQYEITDRAAIEFAQAFYESLVVDMMPVDAALTEARKAVSLGVTNTVEWGTLVLYMRSPDGVLFRLARGQASVEEPLPPEREREQKEQGVEEEPQEPQSDGGAISQALEEVESTSTAEEMAAPKILVDEAPINRQTENVPVSRQTSSVSPKKKQKIGGAGIVLFAVFVLGAGGLVWTVSSQHWLKLGSTAPPPVVEGPKGEESSVESPIGGGPIVEPGAGVEHDGEPGVPVVAVPEEPKEPPKETEKERIAVLLTKAGQQEAAKKLSSPAGDNAVETYQEVLRLESQNEAAQEGIRRIRDRYVQGAKEAEQRGELGKAQTGYEKARQIDPRDGAVVAALDKVKEQQREEKEKKQETKVAALPPQNHPPQIVKRFPEEDALSVQHGEKRTFLATATDLDVEKLTYVWSVDDKKVAEGERFTFAASDAGMHHVSLEVRDPRGLKANAVWNVTVEALKAKPREALLVEPRLVMFTPHQRRLSLFLHQSRFLGVQVVAPGVVEPSLRYQWTVDGQSVSGQEIFEFRDQPIGDHEVTVTVTAPSGASLSQRWTVEVRGVKESDDIGPLWWPRVKVFSGENIVVSPDLPQMTIKGKVRNLDDRRSADNVVVWVIALDKNNQPLSRHLALPTPQPLAPGQVGMFQVSMANHAAITNFHIELLSNRKADEEYQQVMEHLVQRATAAKQKGAWTEAEALYKTAMRVAPPEERLLAEALRELQAARTGGRPSSE